MGGDGKMKVLIFGRTGWLGGMLGDLCKEKGIEYSYANTRLENRESLAKELDAVKPTHVLYAAGLTGRPNVDWCESHKAETIRVNVCGTLNLADLTNERDIHLMVFATGCIFEYDDDKHTMGSGVGFTEEDTPNFHGSFYSHTKALVEDMMRNYPNVCILRVRMPIGDDLTFHRNFIYKIANCIMSRQGDILGELRFIASLILIST